MANLKICLGAAALVAGLTGAAEEASARDCGFNWRWGFGNTGAESYCNDSHTGANDRIGQELYYDANGNLWASFYCTGDYRDGWMGNDYCGIQVSGVETLWTHNYSGTLPNNAQIFFFGYNNDGLFGWFSYCYDTGCSEPSIYY